MITSDQEIIVLEKLVESIQLPEYAYEKAKDRYEDLGKWFKREESVVKQNDPHIFPQGSFRLGTAIRPLNSSQAYDLDLNCKLRKGISKNTHTQAFLKKTVGTELEKYRQARKVKQQLTSKHRCWRLEYQDDLSFYIDIVPSIPADESSNSITFNLMTNAGINQSTSEFISQNTISITDDRLTSFNQMSHDWNISNPEGYATWFENRMNQNQTTSCPIAQVDNIPLFKRKATLQQVIQLLKRHRDKMFESDEDLKPPSIILTTLAAMAYTGEQDIASALTHVLEKMGSMINPKTPRIPNPVNPEEDFADRWSAQKSRDSQLEKNFHNWLEQARIDFRLITSTADTDFICEQATQKLAITLNNSELRNHLGLNGVISSVKPKTHILNETLKPWRS